jgi:hypothetical protein
MNKKKRSIRSTAKLTTLDSFLKEQGKLEEFEAVAIKEVLKRDEFRSSKWRAPRAPSPARGD